MSKQLIKCGVSWYRLVWIFSISLSVQLLLGNKPCPAQAQSLQNAAAEQAGRKSSDKTKDAADENVKSVKSGKKCLFIGHSFFIPVAKTFQRHCKECGIKEHSQLSVFAGGKNGSPGKLWNNQRKQLEIKKILDSGEIELLGMTYFSPDNSSIDDYKRWIDYALKKNPETSFFIGLPWGLNGPKASMAAYAATNNLGHAVVYKGIVQSLRKQYPNTKFYWANYGKVAVELKRAFENGSLENVKNMVSRSGENSIFRDAMGHAAPLTLEMASLVWLAVLYDANPSESWKETASQKVESILGKIAEEEKAFNKAEK